MSKIPTNTSTSDPIHSEAMKELKAIQKSIKTMSVYQLFDPLGKVYKQYMDCYDDYRYYESTVPPEKPPEGTPEGKDRLDRLWLAQETIETLIDRGVHLAKGKEVLGKRQA